MESAMGAAWEAVADVVVAAVVAASLAPLLPLAIVFALLMVAGRRWWLRTLQRRHPALRFEPRTRLAAAMDSARNQGAATALLALRGALRAADMQALLQTRLLGGRARPHLRLALDWRWGRYAWREPDTPFDLARHVIDAPASWRGRPADAYNVQECVSAQAGRLLPPGHPPWQVALLVAGERTYVLVRAHLALLAADKLSLQDLVPMDVAPAATAPTKAPTPPLTPAPPLLGEDDELPPPIRQQTPSVDLHVSKEEEEALNKWEDKISDPPLVPPAPPPFIALPALYTSFKRFALSIIQEIKALDPALGGEPPTGPVRWIIGLLVAAAQMTLRAPGDPRGLRAQFLFAAPGRMCDAILHVLSPAVVARTTMAAAWRAGVWTAAVAPLLALREMVLLVAGRGAETAAGTMAAALMLLAAAIGEVARALSAATQAPRAVLLELRAAWAEPLSELQAASLCGRKALAWSAPVPESTLRRARAVASTASAIAFRAAAPNPTSTPILTTTFAASLSVDEVATAALARALDAYFLLAALPQPGVVPATARALSLQEAMGLRPHRARAWTCLQLPTGAAGEGWWSACAATVEAAGAARSRATGLRAATAVAQAAAATLLPSVMLRMAVNALTRRYAVSITFLREGEELKQREKGRLQLAGCDVEESFVWRPPQANISLSLVVVRAARGLQLGALSDAQLTPAPAFLAVAFERELRRAAGEVPSDLPAPYYSPALTPSANPSDDNS